MSEPKVTVNKNAKWGNEEHDLSDYGEEFTRWFSEVDISGEWINVYFPFFWAPSNHDGQGGPAVDNPLELRVQLLDWNQDAAVTRHYDLVEMILEMVDDQLLGDGSGYDEKNDEWASRTADALEMLAAKIREPIRKKSN